MSNIPEGHHDDPEAREFWATRAKNKAKLRKLAIGTLVFCAIVMLIQHFAG